MKNSNKEISFTYPVIVSIGGNGIPQDSKWS
jgi:hypothetical protein